MTNTLIEGFEAAEGVEVRINRPHQYINVEVTMPPSNGGQDGLRGNFNGVGNDDSLELIEARNLRVASGESRSSIHNKTQFQGVAKCLEYAVLLIET